MGKIALDDSQNIKYHTGYFFLLRKAITLFSDKRSCIKVKTVEILFFLKYKYINK